MNCHFGSVRLYSVVSDEITGDWGRCVTYRKGGYKMPKVLITAPGFDLCGDDGKEVLRTAGLDYSIVRGRQVLSEHKLMALIPEYDALIVGSDPITEQVLRNSKLKVISKHGVGTDNIDLSAAKQRGIIVTVARCSVLENAVADFTMALVLSLAKQIPALNSRTRAGRWEKLLGYSLDLSTLGIIGMGRIGKNVARKARTFGMRVLAWDIAPDIGFAKEFGVDYVDLDSLLAQSDFVVLHVPLTSQTRRLIGRKEFGSMKPGAFLINTGRGGLVDEGELYESLKSGRLAGAALDTFAQEPPTGSALLELPNVIATPHCAAYTSDTLRTISRIAAQNVVEALRGAPKNVCG